MNNDVITRTAKISSGNEDKLSLNSITKTITHLFDHEIPENNELNNNNSSKANKITVKSNYQGINSDDPLSDKKGIKDSNNKETTKKQFAEANNEKAINYNIANNQLQSNLSKQSSVSENISALNKDKADNTGVSAKVSLVNIKFIIFYIFIYYILLILG